jgi:hypothetical protein
VLLLESKLSGSISSEMARYYLDPQVLFEIISVWATVFNERPLITASMGKYNLWVRDCFYPQALRTADTSE